MLIDTNGHIKITLYGEAIAAGFEVFSQIWKW